MKGTEIKNLCLITELILGATSSTRNNALHALKLITDRQSLRGHRVFSKLDIVTVIWNKSFANYRSSTIIFTKYYSFIKKSKLQSSNYSNVIKDSVGIGREPLGSAEHSLGTTGL